MALNIVVLAKQVVDPEIPSASFTVDREKLIVSTPANIPPVVNGFDENALEAALRIRDNQETIITVIAMGQDFAMDVIKKCLSMGADELVLIQDSILKNGIDSFTTAKVLSTAIKQLDAFDLIICGRQASDWDNAQVPQGVAELLGLPSLTLGRKVEVESNRVKVERLVPGGYETVQCSLPALVTVSNELGQPRYPTLRGIMSASRKQPKILDTQTLGLSSADLTPRIEIVDLFEPIKGGECEFIKGENDSDSGRLLAMKLREAKLI